MFQRMVSRMGILTLAGLGLLLVAGSARAQQGWPINGDNWSFYGSSSQPTFEDSSSGSNSPSNSSAPAYATYSPSGSTYYGSTGTEGYYESTTASSSRRSVLLNLRVPSDAKIWLDGTEMTPTGTARSFQSPPLTAGQDYAYQLRVQWKRDGKDVTETRQVPVHAGDVINLTVGLPSGSTMAR